MGCNIYSRQVEEIDKALGTMRLYGVSRSSGAYQQLEQTRGTLMTQAGMKLPRLTSQLSIQTGFSPGVIKLWHDIESGFFSEYRARPGAPPIYHMVDGDEAMAILQNTVSPELALKLEALDEYLGEG